MREPALRPAADVLAQQAATAEMVAPDTRRRRMRRILLRPQPIIVGIALLVLLALAIFGPLLAPYNPVDPDPVNEFLPPSGAHLMGTDDLGRDVFSRVIVGTRYSLLAVAIVLSIGLTAGTLIGAVAGYAGGLLDEMSMRLTDIFRV